MEKQTRKVFRVKDHTKFSASGGQHVAEFAHFEITGAGSTEDEAYGKMFESLKEKMEADQAFSDLVNKFAEENTIEEEIPEEEIRARQEMIDKSHAASAGFKVLTKDTLPDAIKEGQPVLVDFWAEWCGPCHMMAPVLKEAADALGDKVVVAKFNVDEYKEIWQEQAIEGIPTLILFRDGAEVHRIIGARENKDDILKELEPHLS